MPYKEVLLKAALLSLALTITSVTFADDVAKHYKDNCAVCHNEHRLGGVGPGLLPGNLMRLNI
jgi:mono/diheme cytochrome c family protein